MQKPAADRNPSVTCMVLRPVLEAIYRTGKLDSGLELLRRLYANEGDHAQIQKSIADKVKVSPHFAAR